MLEKTTEQPAKPAEKKEPVVVKKYANRRLYNTETSTYVTLDDLSAMVKAERDFVVFDAKSGDDLTHSVLTQIIVEQEGRMGSGQTMLPIPFLRQLIRFYGDSVGKLVPSYLQVSLDTLTREQVRVREQLTSAFTPHGALEAYHEQARKNLSMFEQTMKMFSPFANPSTNPLAAQMHAAATARAAQEAAAEKSGAPVEGVTAPSHLSVVKTPQPASAPAASQDQMAEMKAQLASMQAMIEKLAKDRT
jgi:polyhydroxyalkanoate synthesis repressor PhaR